MAQGTDLNMGIVSIEVALKAETLDEVPMKDESLDEEEAPSDEVTADETREIRRKQQRGQRRSGRKVGGDQGRRASLGGKVWRGAEKRAWGKEVRTNPLRDPDLKGRH